MSDDGSLDDGPTHGARERGIPWRRWSIVLHRDVGYLAVALTIAYAISGIAVNHIADWNPNYRVTKTFTTVAPIVATDASAIVMTALERRQLTEPPRSSFQPDSNTMQLFYKGTTCHVDLPTGKVMVEATRSSGAVRDEPAAPEPQQAGVDLDR